jgi:hypothetical protein
MSKSIIGLVLVEAMCALTWSAQVQAADAALRREAVRSSVVKHCEDICGCWYTTYVHHRALLATYGAGFDPSNYDFTEPHYFFGRERAYPRYSRDPS